MFIGAFLISLIFIVLLIALPFIFKSIFKTRKFMGYNMGVCFSVLAAVTIFMILIVGIAFWALLFRGRVDSDLGILAMKIGALIYILIFILLIYTIIFLFIFYYTKGISNPNQPYNSVFMFIAGYLLPQFVLIYFFFFTASLGKEGTYISGIGKVTSGILILNELFFLLYMIHFAGTIMLSMLHHRKVNKSILYILLVCYFSPIIFFLIGFFSRNIFLLHIPNIVINLATFGFGVFFYCKYAKLEYPRSELLEATN